MKEDRVHTRAKEKVEKENQVKELKKTTEKPDKIRNNIRKRKVLNSVSIIDKKNNKMLLETERWYYLGKERCG